MNFEKMIRDDFEKRLEKVLEKHKDIKNRNGDNGIAQNIINLAERIYFLEDTAYWSIFRKFGETLSTLEGLESICSFVSNFIDDSFYKLERDIEIQNLVFNVYEIQSSGCDEDIEKLKANYKPIYYLVACSDDEKSLSNEQIMVYLKGKLNDTICSVKSYANSKYDTEEFREKYRNVLEDYNKKYN